MSKYTFQQVTADMAESAINDATDAKAADSLWVKIPEGDTQLRLIPLGAGMAGYGPNGNEPFLLRYVHYMKSRDGSKTVHVVCTRLLAVNHARCPACDFIRAAQGRGIEVTGTPNLQAVYNVILRGQEHLGPRLLAASFTLHKDILAVTKRTKGRTWDPTDGGVDIIISRTGTERATRYTVTPCLDPMELGDPRYIEDQHPLNPLLENEHTYEELSGKLAELGYLTTNTRPAPQAARITQGASPRAANPSLPGVVAGSTEPATQPAAAAPAPSPRRAPSRGTRRAQDVVDGDIEPE